MTERAPLVPPEVDLRGLRWMPIDTVRLLDSDLNAISTGEQFRAAVRLWCKAWHQVPAASLPDDDRILATLSGYGSRWKKLRQAAMRGFVKCSDGRWYHPVIAEKALEAWEYRKAQQARANKRWGGGAPTGNVDLDGDRLRRQRVRQAKSSGTHTDAEWVAMLSACGNRCVGCGRQDDLEKDHILPISRGGSDAIENLQPLCKSCNAGRDGNPKDMRPAGAVDFVLRTCHGEAPGMPRHESGKATAMLRTGQEHTKRTKDIVGLPPDGHQQEKNGHDREHMRRLRAEAVQILLFLNQKTGRGYEPVDSNIDPIVARLKEGNTAADIRAVIAKKCREWLGDEKMELYARPKTLFNRTNFANYKGEVCAPA